jgi:hypothetical protein
VAEFAAEHHFLTVLALTALVCAIGWPATDPKRRKR